MSELSLYIVFYSYQNLTGVSGMESSFFAIPTQQEFLEHSLNVGRIFIRSIPCINTMGISALFFGLKSKRHIYRYSIGTNFNGIIRLLQLTNKQKITYNKSLFGNDGLKHESLFLYIRVSASHLLLLS